MLAITEKRSLYSTKSERIMGMVYKRLTAGSHWQFHPQLRNRNGRQIGSIHLWKDLFLASSSALCSKVHTYKRDTVVDSPLTALLVKIT